MHLGMSCTPVTYRILMFLLVSGCLPCLLGDDSTVGLRKLGTFPSMEVHLKAYQIVGKSPFKVQGQVGDNESTMVESVAQS